MRRVGRARFELGEQRRRPDERWRRAPARRRRGGPGPACHRRRIGDAAPPRRPAHMTGRFGGAWGCSAAWPPHVTLVSAGTAPDRMEITLGATLRRAMRVLLLVTALSTLGGLVGVAGAAASPRLPAG